MRGVEMAGSAAAGNGAATARAALSGDDSGSDYEPGLGSGSDEDSTGGRIMLNNLALVRRFPCLTAISILQEGIAL